MNLVEYDSNTCPVRDYTRLNRPWLSVRNKGNFQLNDKAMEFMSLSLGDKVILLQHPDEPDKWFLSKSVKGFELRERKQVKYKSYFHFNHLELYRKIANSIELENNSFRFKIKPEPIKEKGKEDIWELVLDMLK